MNQGPPGIGHPLFDPPQIGANGVNNGHSVGSDCVGSAGYQKGGLTKVSSSITLGGGQGMNSNHQVGSGSIRSGANSGSTSLSHHYSMSSLRKHSVSGPLQSSHHSTSMLGSNSYLNAMSNASNFYVARGGEMR